MHQKIEDFGLDRYQTVSTTQLAPVGVEGIVFEEIAQFCLPYLGAANPNMPWDDQKSRPSQGKAKPFPKRAQLRPAILISRSNATHEAQTNGRPHMRAFQIDRSWYEAHWYPESQPRGPGIVGRISLMFIAFLGVVVADLFTRPAS
jgi:hypothetical protein